MRTHAQLHWMSLADCHLQMWMAQLNPEQSCKTVLILPGLERELTRWNDSVGNRWSSQVYRHVFIHAGMEAHQMLITEENDAEVIR